MVDARLHCEVSNVSRITYYPRKNLDALRIKIEV